MYVHVCTKLRSIGYMHVDANKHHEVSPDPSRLLHYHFWREMRTKKVAKCSPNSGPQIDENTSTKPSLNEETKTNANLNLNFEKGFTLRLSATLRDVKQNVCLITFISGHKSTRSNRRISERIHPGPLPLVFSAPKLRTNLPKDIRTTTNLRRFRVKQINVYMRKQSCKLASL